MKRGVLERKFEKCKQDSSTLTKISLKPVWLEPWPEADGKNPFIIEGLPPNAKDSSSRTQGDVGCRGILRFREMADNKVMKKQMQGFTLAELLIALAILGVIATFTIPKVLQSQQDEKFKAVAKEAAGMISGAYSLYQLNNQADANVSPAQLTQYLNYVRIDTSTLLDEVPTGGSRSCSPTGPCYILHNGAILWPWTSASFGGTGSTNALWFYLDPDGQYSGTTDGPGKSVIFFLYYNGRLRTRGSIEPNTYNSAGGPWNPASNLDPSWFSWD